MQRTKEDFWDKGMLLRLETKRSGRRWWRKRRRRSRLGEVMEGVKFVGGKRDTQTQLKGKEDGILCMNIPCFLQLFFSSISNVFQMLNVANIYNIMILDAVNKEMENRYQGNLFKECVKQENLKEPGLLGFIQNNN